MFFRRGFRELVTRAGKRMLFPVKIKILLPIGLLVVFALSRWPGLMPLNFSAAYAIAFCAGVYLPRRLAWWLPLGALLATDIWINVFFYHVGALDSSMAGNYLAFAAIIWLGSRFSARNSWLKLLGGGLAGAIIFYFVTNTAAWLQLPEYRKNLAGWIQALTVGTPGWPHTWEFFRNTLLSGGLFTGLFVGAMKVEELSEQEEEKSEDAEPAEEPESVGS